MLSLRLIRRHCHHAAAAAASSVVSTSAGDPTSNPRKFEEPALIKIKSERDPEKLFHLFKANAQNRIVIENRLAFEITVSRLAGAGRLDYVEQLLEQQKTLRQGRREGFIIRIIMLYGMAGMVKHSIDTFNNMHLLGCKRTVKSFNAALKVLAQTRNLKALEEFISESSKKFCIELDLISLNIAIKAFCEMCELNSAYTIMVEMERRGIIPDVITYTTLISAFYNSNRWEVGNGLWNLMVLKGCLPNLATFNVRIQCLINKGCAWEANRMMRLMPTIGIIPDEVTYNLVLKGFCRAGYLDMAKRVYSAFHAKGYRSNAKIHQTMIHYLCEGGEFDLAYSMCKDCLGKNWTLSIDSIVALLEGLMNGNKHSRAREIVRLANKRVPPFSSKQMAALQSVLSRKS